MQRSNLPNGSVLPDKSVRVFDKTVTRGTLRLNTTCDMAHKMTLKSCGIGRTPDNERHCERRPNDASKSVCHAAAASDSIGA
jgi:hypothetical protein